MDVYLLDSSWQTIGIVDDFTSLIWRRKYYTVGDFELHCSQDAYPLLSSAAYVYRSDRQEIGVVESIEANDAACTVKGRFLECLLDRCVIYPMHKYSNKPPDEIARGIVSDIFPFEVDCLSVNTGDYTASCQATGDNLMEYTYKLLQTYQSGQRLTYDLDAGRFKYTVYRGLDRRQSQTDNSWAVFSPDWDNVASFSYSRSDKDIKNFAYVAGQGEGEERTVITVDLSDGQPVRQLWVDARDLQKDEKMTDSEYRDLLYQRGLSKLSEYKAVEKFDAEPDTSANLRYMVDYDLGDLCTVTQPKLGITAEKRITVIEEVYENFSFKLSIQFGDGYLIVTDYLKRELK